MLKWWRRYRIRRRVLHSEAKSFFKRNTDTYLDFRYGQPKITEENLSSETLKLEELSIRINSLKSWTERSIYNSYLRIHRNALKAKYRELEERQIEAEVKGDLKKLDEVNDVLDGMLDNMHIR
jgi:hypothetical protein